MLYDFHAGNRGLTNPWLSLAFDAQGNLYGTAQFGGGTSGEGGVFELSPMAGGGWTEKVAHVFSIGGLGGATPIGGLVLDAAGNLYGLTVYGGMARVGVAYELVHSASGGWTEKILHSFGGTGDGREPRGNLVFHDGNLYGVTINSSPSGNGTVFELAPQANGTWSENVLYTFGTGTDGQNSEAAVVFDTQGNLYGTTERGGLYNGGTVFELSPSGARWKETTLYDFATGSEPASSLVFDNAGNLYGTTAQGGKHGVGSVFELSPQTGGGWSERTLHYFQINGVDGFNAFSSLIFDSAGNLYGSTLSGGSTANNNNGHGTVYKLTPQADGTWTESVYFAFDGTDGAGPACGGLIFDASGNLYGATGGGGTYSVGTVFEITP